jgi:hypothetical protein
MKKILTTFLIGLSSLFCFSQPQIVKEISNGSFTFSLGSPITITDQSPITLTPSVSSECTEFLWTTSGTGVFADSSLKNTTYTPSVGDLITDTIILSLKTWCDWGDSAILYSHKIICGQNYEFEALELFSSLTTPLSDTAMIKVNNLIVMLKDSIGVDTLSEFFDRFYLLANETAEASVYDLCDSALARRCTAVNSPTHNAFEGFTFNGTSNYLNTNYNPDTQGVNYTLNNCGVGIYIRAVPASVVTAKIVTGVRVGTTNYLSFTPTYNNLTYYLLNSNALTRIEVAVTNNPYYISATRNSNLPAGLFGYINYSTLTSAGTNNTNGIPDGNIYIGARNLAPATAENFWDGQCSVAFFSEYISEAINTKILNCIEYFMDSNGKGIIP